MNDYCYKCKLDGKLVTGKLCIGKGCTNYVCKKHSPAGGKTYCNKCLIKDMD